MAHHQYAPSPSRPRTVEDVAHQEEVVKTLQKALHTANVRYHTWQCYHTPPSHTDTAATLAVLRPSRHWQDHHRVGHFQAALWVR